MTQNNKVQGKTTRAARAGQIIAGMKKRFTNGSQKLTLDRGAIVITVDDAITGLQSLIDSRAAVVAARAAAKLTITTENAKLPALVALFNGLLAFIMANFGADATALADFGLEPPPARTPLTAEQKAVAVAKRDATRKARGTAGPKQKAKVHGGVNATLVVTPASAAEPATAPEPSAQPAPAANAATPATPPKA